jgi:hypothetical protein
MMTEDLATQSARLLLEGATAYLSAHHALDDAETVEDFKSYVASGPSPIQEAQRQALRDVQEALDAGLDRTATEAYRSALTLAGIRAAKHVLGNGI